MIRPIKSKDKSDFIDYCLIKGYQKDVKKLDWLFNQIMKYNTKCNISDKKGLQGFILVQKQDDKNYVSLVADSDTIALRLMKQYIWNNADSLYIQFPKWNSLVKALTRLGFRITSKRGDATVDLYRQFDEKFYFPKKRIRNYE